MWLAIIIIIIIIVIITITIIINIKNSRKQWNVGRYIKYFSEDWKTYLERTTIKIKV